jgi:hypothetical protein
MEMTGKLRIDRLDNYARATGATGEQVEQLLNTAGSLGSNPSFYGKWDIDVVNGHAVGNIDKLTIGNLDVPQDQLQEYEGLILQAVDARLQDLNIDAQSITVSNGNLSFNGSIPTSVALAP